MALSAFDDKSQPPRTGELATTLGRSSSLWDGLVDHVAQEYPPLEESWVFSGKRWGWALRLKQKKRAVLYMTPCEAYFVVGFALGERAVKAAHETGLAEEVLDLIDSSQKYAEGRGVRLEVRTKRDIEHVMQIAAVKMAN